MKGLQMLLSNEIWNYWTSYNGFFTFYIESECLLNTEELVEDLIELFI